MPPLRPKIVQQQQPARPKHLPIIPDPACDLAQTDEPGWISVIQSDAYFSLESFLATLEELCLHPERNSSSILRAEILYDSSTAVGSSTQACQGPTFAPSSDRLHHKRKIRRKLLPKKPSIDKSLEQDYLFFTSSSTLNESQNGSPDEGLVVLLPDVEREEDVPFYHPAIRKLAFRYRANPAYNSSQDKDTIPQAHISIAALPFNQHVKLENIVQKGIASSGTVQDTADKILPPRTFRTCMHLLETLYKHGWGTERGYEKRVIHDVLVERANFQDLYLVMKGRHKHLDSRKSKPGFNKLEDTKRHVWKDVAVATFLMLLWKDMYPPREKDDSVENPNPWDTWGRPDGGFLDLGCGNALLVHILISEGYKGRGIELRERRTWPTYPAETQAALSEQGIDPPTWFPQDLDEWRAGGWDGREHCPIQEDMFLVGNHADEMTPWLPYLSLIPSTPIPHLSLPCCLHTLNSIFSQTTFVPPEPHPHMPQGEFEQGLEQGESRYKAYLKWLGWTGLNCGWKWEIEPLRVPSTKSWAIVARTRWATTQEQIDQCRRFALQQINKVRQDGFLVRQEGNLDNH